MTKETRQLWRAHAITFLTKISQIAAIFACKRGNEGTIKVSSSRENVIILCKIVPDFSLLYSALKPKEANIFMGKQCICAKVCK